MACRLTAQRSHRDRDATSEDIAEAVLFLGSPSSKDITETVFQVNGGFFMGQAAIEDQHRPAGDKENQHASDRP